MLLLLHDTFSTPQAAFADWIGDAAFTPVHQAYGGRCLAYTHPTLASGIDDNMNWLVTHLAHLPGPIDIVAHGRGGLLARALAADGRLPLRRVCLVGTPNKGTVLAEYANLSRFLDGHVAMLARTSANVAQATLEGALCMLRFVALGAAAALARHRSAAAGQRIAKQSRRSQRRSAAVVHGERASSPTPAATATESFDEFSSVPNDLVVPSDGCHDVGVAVSESLKLGGTEVHHHNYFTNQHVRERLASWLSL